MTRYAAFLRAINVGGHVVTMDRLKALFEEAGAVEVSTVAASGNVVFAMPGRRPAASLERALAAHLEQALGYPVPVFLRTAPELGRIAARDPWAASPAAGATLYVCLLAVAPGTQARLAVAAAATSTDELAIDERELYWRCHGRFSESPLGKRGIERATGLVMTVRNMTTMRKVAVRLAG